MEGVVGSVGAAVEQQPVSPVVPPTGETSEGVASNVESASAISHHGCSSASMSTEDFLSLRSDSTQEPQGTEFDLKKIIEMMIALQLLEEVNEG